MEANKRYGILNNDSYKWIKDQYFTDDQRTVSLEKGEVLLRQGQPNENLYMVLSGHLKGSYLRNSEEFDVLTAGSGMFVGLYSFFSESGKSYASVVAEEPTVVAFMTREMVPTEGEEQQVFNQHMMPILTHELYLRQMKAVSSSFDKQSALHKLHRHERLATLGQLAAGLAHELNNAIGVIANSAKSIRANLLDQLAEGNPKGKEFFVKGQEYGQDLSSTEVRAVRKALIRKYHFDEKTAKKLAKMNLTESDIEYFTDENREKELSEAVQNWKMGQALNNLIIASEQTEHVVQSIRDMGAKNTSAITELNVLKSINKAIVLLGNVSKQVNLEVKVEETLHVPANEGEMIQVWINLLKNAIEALVQAKIKEPKIQILSSETTNHHRISIIDNGPGIPKELIDQVFHPNVTTKVHGLSFGLGLGLSIVEKLVVGYGGKIWVRSQVGRTEFIVQLPKN